jgi:predicted ATP-grasp superfamily ATP-dependent carboligase
MAEKLENGRVIVTYGRSLIALMIAQSLGARGVDIIGCDDVGMTVLSFSQYVSKNEIYASPDADEDQFIEDLLRIAKDHKPDDDRPYVLMPAFRDAKIIAKHAERFEGVIALACPSFEAIDRVDHKDAFAQTTEDLDVESLKTWLPADEADLEGMLEDIEFPVFIKPPDDVGGRGISKIDNEAELKAAFADLQARYKGEQILIQALAEGVDYCFCGLFDNGRLVASMVYHNLQKFPNEAGPGVVRETVDSARFDTIAEDLMKPLGWHGVAGIDFMWDEDENSTPMMIEVNPRFWAGLDHSIKSNVDFPWLLYQMIVKGSVDPDIDVKIGHKTSLPGLSTMAGIETLFSEAIDFESLEKQWPAIKAHLQDRDLKQAGAIFKDAMSDSFSLDEALKTFQSMRREVKEAQKISYGEDDPFIGLGALFILGSLIRHGTLPPEITR